MARQCGTVKWFSDAKGFGFITADGDGQDVFVHFSGIEGKGHRTLADGERVEYEAVPTAKGAQAVHVTKAA